MKKLDGVISDKDIEHEMRKSVKEMRKNAKKRKHEDHNRRDKAQ